MNFLKNIFFLIFLIKYTLSSKDCTIEVGGNKINLCKYKQRTTNEDFKFENIRKETYHVNFLKPLED